MAWKSGKHGRESNGRTVRSSFSTRNEGILVLKETHDAEENKISEVVYSLGKQNRWLIPEIVKDSSNSRTDFGYEEDMTEDMLFVERVDGLNDRNKRLRRGDCMSVYDSASGQVWQPKRRYGQMNNFIERANKAHAVYEVIYPNRKGHFTLNSQKSSKKKYRGKKRSRVRADESEWQQEHEQYFFEEDHFEVDYGDEYDSMTDHGISLGDFIYSHKKDQVNTHSEMENSNYTDNELQASTQNNKLIVIEDEEMTAQHNEMYTLARKTNHLLSKIFYETASWGYRGDKGKKRYYRKLLRKLNREEEISLTDNHEDGNLKLIRKESSCLRYPLCDIKLWIKDLDVLELETAWGDMYLEGASYPRKFAIHLSMDTSSTTGLSSLYILFELNNSEAEAANYNTASIKLLLVSEMTEADIPEETTKLIVADFCDEVGRSSEVMGVKDVVDIAIRCTKKHLETSKLSDIKMNNTFSLKLYENILGWKSQCQTENEAFHEIKKDILEKNRIRVPLMLESFEPNPECRICFEDLTDKAATSFTSMSLCGHSFCNDCWKTYLETKLNSGQVDVLCPEHSCKTVVDLVTIMSVVPSLYGKYLTWKIKRGMASSPLRKNCPHDYCKFVMKVSACDGAGSEVIPPYLPVSCGCKNIWCFSCQEQAHWPAPCDKAKKFRASNKGYVKARKGPKLPEITAVSVKKCPKCSYPIEKYQGCNNMYCIMCNNGFCWHCLKLFNDVDNGYYGCCYDKEEVPSTVMDIPFSTSEAQRVVDFAVVSFCKVKAGFTVKMCDQLKSMKQGLEAHLSLKNLSETFASSFMGSVLDSMIANNVTHVLKDAYCFEIQAHIALEGMLICIVSGSRDRIVHGLCWRLLFIMEKLTVILNETDSLHKEEDVNKVNELIKNGQKCLMELGRHVKRNL